MNAKVVKDMLIAVVIWVLIMWLYNFAFAAETDGAEWEYTRGKQCYDHTHEYTDNDTIYNDGEICDRVDDLTRRNPVYIGVDFMLLQSASGIFGLELQGRYDSANEEGSSGMVLKLNPWTK